MKKKFIFLSLVFLVILALVLFSWFNFNAKRKARVGLEGFYELTLKDPLFFSPFFDTQEFERAIKELKKEEDELKKVTIANMEAHEYKTDYIPILQENNLFPYQFLENLILINQETEEFLQTPSVERAESLLSLYDTAADSYLEAVSSKIKILEKINPTENNPIFFFMVDSVTNSQVIKNDYYVIKENGYKLKEEIAKRRNCLLGKENCQVLIKTKDNSSFIALMKAEEFDLKGENIDFIKSELLTYPGIEIVKGPYKIKSLCWQSPDFEHWMYLIYYKENGRTIIFPKIANQNYYSPVPAVSTNRVSQTLAKNGIKFILQSETTSYECMDLTFYPQLLTLDFLKKQIEKGLITKENLEKNLNYKLLIENQFGLLAPAINDFSKHLKALKGFWILEESSVSPEYLLYVRTPYSIFYFPFAKSIWRIDKELKYFVPEEEIPINPSKFVTLDELKEMGYSETEIKKFNLGPEELFEITQP